MQALILITFLLTPAYLVRFNLGPLPTNLLMLWVFFIWIIFAVWLILKNKLPDFHRFLKSLEKKTILLIALFFLSGIISLFINDSDQAKLGQFIVLFLQPISIFFIAGFIFQKNPKTKSYLLLTTYYLLALAGLYAIIQYFTLLGLPSSWWGNAIEPKRSISFFVHPNFYALWSAPLLAFLIPDLMNKIKNLYVNRKLLIVNCFAVIAWLVGALGLLLSFSRAGWLGLAAAISIYAIVVGDRKIRKLILSGAIIIVVAIVAVPNLRWRFLLPFYGEKSASSRIELWQSGWRAIKTSPIFGLGLNGYANNYREFQTDTTLPNHNFPHNIFLNFWVETGVMGLIVIMGLIGLHIYRGLKNPHDLLQLSVSLFLIAILFQGLIDNPYFKNDLAMVFWIILSLAI